MNTPLKIATGFISGTILGASIALLLAPRKGSQTRKLIGDQAKDVSDKVSRTYTAAARRVGLDRKPKANVAV